MIGTRGDACMCAVYLRIRFNNVTDILHSKELN